MVEEVDQSTEFTKTTPPVNRCACPFFCPFIDKVVVERAPHDAQELTCRTVWKGNAVTSSVVLMPTTRLKELKALTELTAEICKLAREGIDDETIASQLSDKGFHSPTSNTLLASTVTNLRLRNGVRRTDRLHPRRKKGLISVPDLAKVLGKNRTWILERIYDGTIKVLMDPECHCYLFPNDEQTLELIKLQIAAYSDKKHGRGGHQHD